MSAGLTTQYTETLTLTVNITLFANRDSSMKCTNLHSSFDRYSLTAKSVKARMFLVAAAFPELYRSGQFAKKRLNRPWYRSRPIAVSFQVHL